MRPPDDAYIRRYRQVYDDAIKGTPIQQPLSAQITNAREFARVTREAKALTDAASADIMALYARQYETGVNMSGPIEAILQRTKAEVNAISLRGARRAGLELARNTTSESLVRTAQSLSEINTTIGKLSMEVGGQVKAIENASYNNAVSLIEQMMNDYGSKYSELVNRSTMTGARPTVVGRNMGREQRALNRRTTKRATNIGRDQTRKGFSSQTAARMRDSGITEFIWMHSGAGEPRPTHIAQAPGGLNGGMFRLDNPPVIDPKTGERGLPGQLINCVTPDTRISGTLSAGLKSFYRGKVRKIVTTNNRDLTVTPNHQVMTNRGLVAAAEVSEGDYLVAYSGEVESTGRGGDLDVQNADTRAEDVFATLAQRGLTTAISRTGVDLHGDERFVDEDIYRVLADRPLTFGMDPDRRQALDYLKFISTYDGALSLRPLFERFQRVFLAPSRLLGCAGESLALFGRAILGPQKSRFAATTGIDLLLAEDAVDHRPRHAVSTGEGLDRLPPGVALDEIVSVLELDFCDHVYDFQEESGLIIANGLVISNCKCIMIPVLNFTPDGAIVRDWV